MNDSTASLVAVLFGLGVFAVIVAVGWRSVQNRRIVRLQGADGQETIIIADEDDQISSIVTTTETAPAAVPPEPAADKGGMSAADSTSAPEFGRKTV